MFRAWAAILSSWLAFSALVLCPVPAPAQVPALGAVRAPVLNSRVARAFSAAARDATALAATTANPTDLHATRYFYFSTREPVQLARARLAFQLHLNFLSRYSLPIQLHYVTPDLVRVDIDLLEWDRGTLEAAQHVDVFFHERKLLEEDTRLSLYWPGGKESRGTPIKGKVLKGQAFAKKHYEETFKAGEVVSLHARWLPPIDAITLRKLLFTEVPVLCAEWFLVQSSRQTSLRNSDKEGLGYYDFLKLANRDDFFLLVEFSKEGSKRLGKKLKAAQEFSKVSPTGRQIDADQSQSGALWVALDAVDATGEGVAIRQLRDGTFLHKIEEWYGTLANGLPTTFLSNELGVRANNAPADAVGLGDNSPLHQGNDHRIHIHISCIRCHEGSILRPIKDYVRETYGNNPLALGDPDKKAAANLQKQYFGDLEDKLATDRLAYQKAIRRATRTPDYPNGVSAQKAIEAYVAVYHTYADHPVTLEIAAQELGTDTETFARQLEWLTTEVKLIDARLAPLVRLGSKKSLPIQRLTWEDSFELAMDVSHGIVPRLRRPITNLKGAPDRK